MCNKIEKKYWHANPFMYKQDDIMYKNTIAKEVWKRDKKVNKVLEKNGYKVLRFWEEILKIL